MSRYLRTVLLLSLLTLLPLSAYAAAEEITSFHSEIAVDQSGSAAVTETIEVTAAGDQIKRGISLSALAPMPKDK